MSAYIKQLTDINGNDIFPRTTTSAIIDPATGASLSDTLNVMASSAFGGVGTMSLNSDEPITMSYSGDGVTYVGGDCTIVGRVLLFTVRVSVGDSATAGKVTLSFNGMPSGFITGSGIITHESENPAATTAVVFKSRTEVITACDIDPTKTGTYSLMGMFFFE